MAYQTNTPEESSATEQMKDAGQQLMEGARDTFGEVQSRAGDYLRTEADRRSHQLGEQARDAGSDLREVGSSLREQGNDRAAKVADEVAERVERVAQYVERTNVDGMLQDVEDYARRNPMTVAVGGLALGFLASRFLRASSSYARRQEFEQPQAPRYPKLDSGYPVPRSTEQPGHVVYGDWEGPERRSGDGRTVSGGV